MKKAVREAIIDIAQEIFARFGYRKTSMETIARAARKAKSSVYYYFKNKEEIILAVIDKEVSMLKKEISNALALAAEPEEKLRIYAITRMRIFSRIARHYSSFKHEYYEEFNFIQKVREKYDMYEMKVMREILSEGVKKGIFVIDDIPMTAYAIIVAIKGFEYSWATEPDIARLEKSIDNLSNILFRGILKR
jgi:AcrR family transcriptional regulator